MPDAVPRRLLYEGDNSGAGELANWEAAAALAFQTQLILAGGLNADNVTAAISRVRPWGVDVSSGVEKERGVKDPDRIRAFVQAVRLCEQKGGESE
jgi:phosphoribosylanthranilate isomerase